MQNIFCPWESAQYLFFSSSVPSSLLYYSHGISVAFALFFSIFLILKTKKNLSISILFALTILFSIWVFIDLLLWAGNNPVNSLFYWSVQIMIEIFIYLNAIYLCYVFISKKDLSLIGKIILFSPIIPILIFLPTKYLLPGVDISTCVVNESNIIIIYSYAIESLIILSIVFLTQNLSKNYISNKKKEAWLFALGIILFLLAFSSGNIIGSLTENWEIAQLGLFLMPVFIIILSYLAIEYRSFNVKLFATQALMWGLTILIGSQFFFIKIKTNFILNGITFLGVIILGRILVRSVQKEVKQREQLQILSEQLFGANEKLKGLDKLKSEFLSLAAHQLRSPLTAIKGYASMVTEGAYGEINPQAKEAVDRIFQSSQNLAKVVEDLLDVSKIEQGGMKFVMEPFSMIEIARDMEKDLSITAEKRGLKMQFESDGEEACMVNGDKEKLRQVVLNFIDNSIKYTKEGTISVSVKRVGDKVQFRVKDTGMGMTPEVKASLFQKFARGDGARMNTTGSGLGLYLAKEIVEAHKGEVMVDSEGLGKGSTFGMDLDAIK